MANFAALRHFEEPLLDPYWPPDLCPANLCPRDGERVTAGVDPSVETVRRLLMPPVGNGRWNALDSQLGLELGGRETQPPSAGVSRASAKWRYSFR